MSAINQTEILISLLDRIHLQTKAAALLSVFDWGTPSENEYSFNNMNHTFQNTNGELLFIDSEDLRWLQDLETSKGLLCFLLGHEANQFWLL